MRGAEEGRRSSAGAFDGSHAKQHVPPNIARGLEMQLPVKVSVISDLMTFAHRAMHELRPAFGMSSQNEKRCLHAKLGQRVENAGRRVRVWAVVERERDLLVLGRKVTEHRSKHEAVAVECPVSRGPE